MQIDLVQLSPERHSLLHRSLGGKSLLVELEAGRGRGVLHPADAFQEKRFTLRISNCESIHREVIVCSSLGLEVISISTWGILAAIAASGQGRVAARGVDEDGARAALHLLGGGHDERHGGGGVCGAL